MSSGRIDADMFNRSQFVAGCPAEVGVRSQYFDSELHLVNHALARAVSAVEQFEVFKSIILSIAVLMMHCFFGKKLTAEMLRYNVAMFQHGVFFAGNEARHGNPNVSVPLDMAADISAVETIQRHGSLVFRFAKIVAVLLLYVKSASRLAAFYVFDAAMQANKSMCGLVASATTRAGTVDRAVHRFSSEFLFVCGNVRLHHAEWFAAFFAGEVRWDTSYRQFASKSGGAAAQQPAVATVFTWVRPEWLLTVFTNFLNRHGYVLSLAGERFVALPIGEVK